MRFLTPSPAVTALSPLHARLDAAGATFERRGGWAVATGFADRAGEARAVAATVGWADASYLAKLELHAGGEIPLGTARREDSAWWCAVTPSRTLILAEPQCGAALRTQLGDRGVDVTTQLAALIVAGPAARETIARFCAIDLRPRVSPPGTYRSGSIARTPGAVLVEGTDRFLVLFGAALAEYVWTVASDAGSRLGGRPVGADAVREEAFARA